MVRYRVTFPGPVGTVNGGLAATVVYVVEADLEECSAAEQIGEQIARYVKGVGASSARHLRADVTLHHDGSGGAGGLWTPGLRSRRIGTFQVERIEGAGTTEG